MAKSAWYPDAVKLDQGTDAGYMIGGQPHATLHDTETRGWAGKQFYHIQFNEVTPGDVQIRQYRPFNKAAPALRNRSGGVQTNRQGSVHIQPSVVGYAKDAPNRGAWTPAMYAALNKFALWCRDEWGIPLRAEVPKVGGGICYGYGSVCRFTNEAWRAYAGWSAHQNAPENTHWDCGNFDWKRMLKEADDMFTSKGDKGDVVLYWQLRILRIDPNALPIYGADADYGGECQAAVSALVPGSTGLRIGPIEAEALDALVSGSVDLSAYAKTDDVNLSIDAAVAPLAAKGTYSVEVG